VSLASGIGDRFKVEFVGQFVSMASGALLIVILARLLDPNQYGLLFLSISVFSIAQIFSKLGLAKSAARYISEYRENDPGQIPHILRKSIGFNLITIFVVSAVFIIGYDFIAVAIGESELGPFLALGSLLIIFGSLTMYARLVAQGFEDIRLAAEIHAVDHGTRLIFAVGFVLLGYGALGALGGFILGSFLASLIGLIILYTRYYQTVPSSKTMEQGLFRRVLEYNIPLTVAGLSGKIDKEVDTVLVGFFLSPVAVGYYALSKQVVKFVQMPATALGFSISPTYGKQKAANDLSTAATMYEKSLVHTLLLYVPAAIGIVLVAGPSINIIFGDSYTDAVPVLQILSIYVVLKSITKITDYPLDYLGRARSRAIAQAIASVSNVLLNILLIPRIGVIGAAIATVITHSFYVSVKLYIVSTELPLDIRHIWPHISKIVFISSIMGGTVWFLSKYITGFLSLFLVISAGMIVWGISSIFTGVIDSRTILESFSS
jgi:O-antigen/teichoic acid export membrane protein